jgi:hypothetical protein
LPRTTLTRFDFEIAMRRLTEILADRCHAFAGSL